STRKPDTRPPLADENPAAAGRVRGHLMRRGTAGIFRRIACGPVPNTDPLERRTDERVFDREPEEGGRGLYGRARARDRGAVRAQAPRLRAPWHLLSAV